MDLKQKIIRALSRSLAVKYARLEDDDGISGFIVSPRFEGMPALDRQRLIDDALAQASPALTSKERRRVLMIAALTPLEHDAVGARIRVHKVKEMAGGAVEILLRGTRSDAEYVREALHSQDGVRTTEPRDVPGAAGILMSFRARGTQTAPLTRARAIRVLKKDRYIEVMQNA